VHIPAALPFYLGACPGQPLEEIVGQISSGSILKEIPLPSVILKAPKG